MLAKFIKILITPQANQEYSEEQKKDFNKYHQRDIFNSLVSVYENSILQFWSRYFLFHCSHICYIFFLFFSLFYKKPGPSINNHYGVFIQIIPSNQE